MPVGSREIVFIPRPPFMDIALLAMVLSIPLILVILNSLLLTATVTAAPLYNNRIRTNCTGATYATNSMYARSLNTLLSTLESQSSFSNYNTSIIGSSPNRVYGLYLCEGDLSTADCKTCIQSATANITAAGSCPSFTQAIIWYDYCMVRYSDTNFFGVMDSNGFSMTNPNKSQVVTSRVPYQMVSSLVQVAPLRRLMFATNASTSTNAYALAQCTGDLNSNSCRQCLNTILGNIKSCCTSSNGWRYLSASCWVRYESTPFLRDLSEAGALAPQHAMAPMSPEHSLAPLSPQHGMAPLSPQHALAPLSPNAAGGGKTTLSMMVAVILGPILGLVILDLYSTSFLGY